MLPPARNGRGGGGPDGRVREAPPFWTDTSVSQESQQFLSKLFDHLLRFDFREDGEPYLIEVGAPAKQVYVDWYNIQAAEPWLTENPQIFEALLAKLRGQCLRICLILHCLESAASGLSELREVSLETMENAIKIANCIKIHQKRETNLSPRTVAAQVRLRSGRDNRGTFIPTGMGTTEAEHRRQRAHRDRI